MSDRRPEQQAAQAYLAGLADPISTLATQHGIVEASLPTRNLALDDRFGRLVLNIAGQSISLTAAAAIFGRLSDALGGHITAEGLAPLDEETLRQLGFS